VELACRRLIEPPCKLNIINCQCCSVISVSVAIKHSVLQVHVDLEHPCDYAVILFVYQNGLTLYTLCVTTSHAHGKVLEVMSWPNKLILWVHRIVNV